MTQRSITRDEVEKTLGNPFEVVPVRYRRSAACSRLSNRRYLVVIYERIEEDFIVVTALKVNRQGAIKYGFTRV